MTVREFGRWGAIAGACACAALLGRELALPHGSIYSAAWPSAGVGLALLLCRGVRYWPAIFVGEVIGLAPDLYAGAPSRFPLLAAAVGVGAVTSAVLGTVLVRQLAAPAIDLREDRRTFLLLVLGGLVGSAVGMVVQVSLLRALGYVPPGDEARVFLRWWLSAVVGVACFAPLVLVWIDELHPERLRAIARTLGAKDVLLLGLCLATAALVFLPVRRLLSGFLFPALIAVAFRAPRFGPPTITPVFLVASVIGTSLGRGPFAQFGGDFGVLQLQLYFVVLSGMGLTLSALLTTQRDSERALRESQRITQAIIDNSPAYIFVKDLAGRYLVVNKRCEEIVNRPRSELIGLRDTDFLPPDVAETFIETDRIVAETGRAVTREEVLNIGEERIVTATKFPLVDENGVTIGVCGISTDITDQLAEQRSAAEKLRESVSLLQATLESTADGILALDHHGRIVASNERFRSMWRLPAALVEAGDDLAVRELVRDQFRSPDEALARLREIEANPAGTSLDVVERSDGRVYERFSMPQSIEDRIVGRVWSFRDVTEARRAEEALDALVRQERAARTEAQDVSSNARFLAEASAILTDSLDHEATLNRVAHLSVPFLAAACVVELLDKDEVRRRIAVAPVPANDLCEDASVQAAAERALRTGVVQVDRFAGHDPDSTFVVAQPLVVRGRVVGVLTLVTTGTAQRAARNLPLVAEVARRCAVAIDNAELFKEAQRAIKVREDFLSIASHELRTPLTPLGMQLGILRRLLTTEEVQALSSYDRLAKVADLSQRQVGRLLRLVGSLLDASRVSEGRLDLELEDVDLVALTREIVTSLDTHLTRAGATVNVSAAEPVHGRFDRLRLEQVVTNLLTNAIKFGGEQPIDVALRVDARHAELSVRDRGPGVAAEDRERIFGRFERAASIRKFEGIGLGLFIAREIVRRHGGRIYVESPDDGGARFVVVLPLDGEAAQTGVPHA